MQDAHIAALSANGARLAVGAVNNDGGGSNAGHVRIYEWNGTAWTQMGTDIDGEAANNNSGSSVALSSNGSRVAIGAYFNNDGGSFFGGIRIRSPRTTAVRRAPENRQRTTNGTISRIEHLHHHVARAAES